MDMDKTLTIKENSVKSFQIGSLSVQDYNAEVIRELHTKELTDQINKARLNGLEPVYKITEFHG
jgi:hypothetical protein